MNKDEPICCMSNAPTELLIYIFEFLRPIQLVKCRQVCMRWKLIIDNMLERDPLWREFCKRDFSDLYKVAFYKCKSGLRWCSVYRTLSLWPRIREATESRDEFAPASDLSNAVRHFQVLRDGIIGVHRRDAIIYYDLETMEPFKTGNIHGSYLDYMENESTILILGNNLSLSLFRKYVSEGQGETNATFHRVKTFILRTHEVYFVTIYNVVYICRLDEKEIKSVQLAQMSSHVMCIGYSTQLNLLTNQRDIYSLIGKEFKLQCTLGPRSNLLHLLKKYSLLEHLDRIVYSKWMIDSNQSIPQGPLRNIVTIKTYGDAVFVGSHWGKFRIYYAPYINDDFDIINSEPIKEYNFMEPCDCPILSMCPIIQIDIVEGEDCHSILVAMPKKIVVITYSHDLYKSKSVPPYTDSSEVQIRKITG
ncbi:unnamed protein product, partial [Brenthis ino]